MSTLLAVISGASLVNVLIAIVVAAVIFWVVSWAIAYIGIPEPFNKVLRVLLALIVVVYLINALMGLTGEPFIRY